MSRPYEVPGYVRSDRMGAHVGATQDLERGTLFSPAEAVTIISFAGTVCGVIAGLMFGDIAKKASIGGLVGTSVGMVVMVRGRIIEREQEARAKEAKTPAAPSTAPTTASATAPTK